MVWSHPTGGAPSSVTLVALGPSKDDYIKMATRHTPAVVTDEIWVINTAIRHVKHDLAFIMDDMKEYAAHFPAYGKLMHEADKPIITSTKYPEFKQAHAYPLAQVLNTFEQFYFNNSIPYVVAYAMLIGVKHLVVFGADYTHPASQRTEEGRSCTEFWLGFASARGVHVQITDGSTLMDANQGLKFYGYIRQPRVSMGNGQRMDFDASNIYAGHNFETWHHEDIGGIDNVKALGP